MFVCSATYRYECNTKLVNLDTDLTSEIKKKKYHNFLRCHPFHRPSRALPPP